MTDNDQQQYPDSLTHNIDIKVNKMCAYKLKVGM